MPILFNYIDYKKYLQDFYLEKKEKKNYFSFRNLASKINGDSSNLHKVIYGKRHPSKNLIDNFVTYCKFSPKESDFFRLLVLFSKSKSEQETQALFENILKFKQVKQIRVRSDQYQYYQKWYHTAIFSLLDYYPFTGDYKALSQKLSPSITAREARESIELLESLNFIQMANEGRYIHTNKAITTGEGWLPIAVKKYQEETIKLSLHSLENHPKEFRDISSISVTASEKGLDDIRKLTKEYRQSIIKMVEQNQEADNVYQINIQIFPLTQVDNK